MACRAVLLLAAGIAALARSQHCDSVPGASCLDDEASLLQSSSKEAAATKAHVQEHESKKEIQQHNASSKLQHSEHTCEKDTGGKCGWSTCDASRGGDEAVECTSGWYKFCKCKEGYCAVGGKCVLEYTMGYGATLTDTYCEDKGQSCKASSEEEAHEKCTKDAACAGVYHPGNHPQDWMLCKAPLKTMPSRDGSTVTPKD
eukprot:TRINITY_DN431_c0_g2_i2.p1 TRINITY_DN431_c0_g2~~TRINITY_DN431_c0_g2_i2.p1  ORF type:complete len:217 (+),score=37.14 TRINITY_DN431_c0_g2_i2:51-653(+)